MARRGSHYPRHPNRAVAACSGSLARWIARFLEQTRLTGSGPGVIALAALLVVASSSLSAQSEAHPAFQVASIKPSASSGPPGMSVRPLAGGRLTTRNAPVALLIQFAYSVQAFQVVGGPAWLNSDGYDIEAKPEGYTDREHVWLMLQTLLADRFKLALHRETRDLPVYALTAAKSGLKLPSPKEGGCVPREPDAPTAPPRLAPGQFYCGGFGVATLPTGMRMQGSRISMAEFVKGLSRVVGRPVLDKTGFSGEFDVHLDFAPEDAAMGGGGPGDPAAAIPPASPSALNIFVAMEEQLGLKLTSAKGPVEVLVIDSVQKPTVD